jgi:hypothetical protein
MSWMHGWGSTTHAALRTVQLQGPEGLLSSWDPAPMPATTCKSRGIAADACCGLVLVGLP